MLVTLKEHKISNVFEKGHQIATKYLLLDTQADKSKIPPYLLSDLRDAAKTIKMKGFRDFQMVFRENGILKDF
jgi:hypothetical protein